MSIDDPDALESLIARLRALQPDAERCWGTLDAGEMLCHLGDGHEAVLDWRDQLEGSPEVKPRPILKWIALYSPLPWSKRAKTAPSVDPRQDGTRPSDFEADRERDREPARGRHSSRRRVGSGPRPVRPDVRARLVP